MARPKVHEHERRTTGLRLSAPVHDALRRYNRDTGVPMTKVIELALEEKLMELGYYRREKRPQPTPPPSGGGDPGNGRGGSIPLPVPKRQLARKRT